jgi:2-phosphosulfolactate phosphatase
MRIDVVLTAEAVQPEALAGRTALVVDVLRASTSMIAALSSGASAIIPVGDPTEARQRAEALSAGAVIAGERRGERIAGFDLGNSPLDFTRARVAGRTIVFTTSNGTRALLASRGAAAVGIAALVNAGAAAAWADAEGRDVTIVCAGERGRESLEDHVCAGVLVERLTARVAQPELGDSAARAASLAKRYGKDVAQLADDSEWARRLARAGHAEDIAVCLAVDTTSLVPVYLAGVDKVVSGPR